jgi:hypothetical protein
MVHKGKYKVKHRQKYVGNVNDVTYRSSWERRFMVYCDKNPGILRWNSEEVIIPYYSPVDRKTHKYYVDFLIQTDTGMTLIEVKPDRQTRPPKMGGTPKSKGRYLKEMKTWKVNEAKWIAAERFCEERGWIFKILTEKHLVR